MFAAGRVNASGDLDFAGNPLRTIVVGPIGTGTPAFPSTARNILPQVPVAMRIDPIQTPLEKNGFSIVDVRPDQIEVRFYAWRPPEAVTEIESLRPVMQFSV